MEQMIYICEHLTHKRSNNMTDTATATPKKAEYRFPVLFGNLPSARLMDEKYALSAQLGISIAQLNRIIRGDSDPSGTQLRIIADFFGVQVDDLYSAEVEE